jgi:hypothetical protein
MVGNPFSFKALFSFLKQPPDALPYHSDERRA